MRIPLLAVGLFASVLPMRAAVNYDRLLACIAEIEQGDPKNAGNISNISYSAWETAAPDIPYHMSANEAICLPICKKHLAWLSAELRKVGCRVNAQTLGTCWRHGFTGARRLGFKCDQGQRTANLYADASFHPKPYP